MTTPSHKIARARAEDFVASLPDGSVHLIATDPPYHKVKSEAWDRQWKTDDDFLKWIGDLAKQWRRVLAPNGSLYVFASPQGTSSGATMASRVEACLSEHFAVLSQITWRKTNMLSCPPKCGNDLQRTYVPFSERIIFAEQYGADAKAMGEARYDAKCDELRGFVFEPLRAYLDGERERAGLTRAEVDKALGNQMAGHYFSRIQWTLPTRANYEKMREAFNARGGGNGGANDYLRRDYEDLRRDYEDLRRPFSVTADVPYTDVWDFPTVQHYKGKHVCEKPAAMAEHIVRASSRPGDVVADFFSGSGVFLAAAAALGRVPVGCDMDPHWHGVTLDRVKRSAESGKVEPAIVGAKRGPPQRVQVVETQPTLKQLSLF